MNPAFTRSIVTNGSGTRFNILDLDQHVKYKFSVKGAETTANSVEMEFASVLRGTMSFGHQERENATSMS
ncbi:hypothetical protein NX059_011259 [Plenodomus lindquistii]|nr:hypothetical protein NX059_011259 [Plenodomus lindquistii]